jgi:hypothetical protein
MFERVFVRLRERVSRRASRVRRPRSAARVVRAFAGPGLVQGRPSLAAPDPRWRATDPPAVPAGCGVGKLRTWPACRRATPAGRPPGLRPPVGAPVPALCRSGMLRLPPQRSVRPTNVGCGTSEEKRRWRAPRPRASRRLLLRPTPARPQLPVLFVSRSLTPVLFVSRPQLPVQFLSRPQLPVLFEVRSLTRVLLVLRRRPVAALERRRLRFRRTCCPTGLPLSCCRSPGRV